MDINQPNTTPTPPHRHGPWVRVASIAGFELGLGAVALILASWLGLNLGEKWQANLSTLNWAVLTTLPVVGVMWTLTKSQWGWVRVLNEPLDRYVRPMFQDIPTGGLLVVAMAAGLGEELLFRGVIQGGISQWAGASVGLVISSIAFGFAHALNRYYVMVTLLMGLYLGMLYQASQNLVLVVLVHGLYDWIVLRYLLFDSRFEHRR
jgi:membrane protease YdiL (CAAX protease family)